MDIDWYASEMSTLQRRESRQVKQHIETERQNNNSTDQKKIRFPLRLFHFPTGIGSFSLFFYSLHSLMHENISINDKCYSIYSCNLYFE